MLTQSGTYRGQQIFFTFPHSQENTSQSPSLENYIQSQSAQTYVIPKVRGQRPQPTQMFPVRVDWRRDVIGSWQISYNSYASAGTLPGRTFPVAVPYGVDTTLWLEFEGYFPPGTNVVVSMTDTQGNIIPTAGAPILTRFAGGQAFTPYIGGLLVGPSFIPSFALTTSDPQVAPRISRVRVFINPDYDNYLPIPVTVAHPNKLEALSWSGSSSDPTLETCRIKVWDMLSTDTIGDSPLDILRYRAQMLMQVAVNTGDFDGGGNPVQSILSRSYVVNAGRTVYGNHTGKEYPGNKWCSYDIIATGMWQRLWEQTMPTTRDFSANPTDLGPDGEPLPYKITDILRILLNYCFTPNMTIVPDKSIRFFGPNSTAGPQLRIEFLSQIGPYIVQLARDYLGAWLTFDCNATSIFGAPPPPGSKDPYGAWRILFPPNPPFNNLWGFWTTPQTEKSGTTYPLRAPLSPSAYPETFNDLGEGSSFQTQKNTWVRRLFHSDVQPPEFNLSWVTGQGVGAAGNFLQTSGENQKQLTARAFNPKSARFWRGQSVAPDPTSPDYLGRVVIGYKGNRGDTSQAAVNFDARRQIQIAGHGRARFVIEAPLMFNIDQTDLYQIRPRIPRFGDPCLLDGNQCYINSVNPSYSFHSGGNRAQLAVYELYSIFNPDDFIPLPDDVYN